MGTFHDFQFEWIFRPISHYALQQQICEEVMLEE
jgi:hypothetical protein